MSEAGARYRCTLCGVIKDKLPIAQTHVKHNHPPDSYEAVNASIEELSDTDE